MIVDQADEVAESTARDGRRLWWLSALDQPARPSGRWPVPPAGSPRTARQVLGNEAGAPKAARDFTRAALERWDLGELTEDVTVVVSELVTNALRHGLAGPVSPAQASPIQLALFGHTRRLVVVVTDPSDRIPTVVPAQPDNFCEGGRGLLVVEAMSSAWGWASLSSGGKAVWAAFEVKPVRPLTAEPLLTTH